MIMRSENGATDPIQEQLRRLMDGVGPGEDATQDMLQLTGIVKRYGDFAAANGLDLRVPRGEIFGFLGPNGAGKTTTIRMIAGVLEPTEGSIVIGGYDLETHPLRAKSRIGYIPDRPFLYEKLSGGEFLRFVSGIWGKDEPASRTGPMGCWRFSTSWSGSTSSSKVTPTVCARNFSSRPL